MPASSMEELTRSQQSASAQQLAAQLQGSEANQAGAEQSNQAMLEEMEAAKGDKDKAQVPTLEELQSMSSNTIGGFAARVIEYTGTEVSLDKLLLDSEHKRPITRGEAATVIYEALELEETFEGRPEMFKDVPMSDACAIPLYRCRQEGIFEGPGQERFLPDELLRAEHVLPLLQLVETWTDSTGADTSILGEGDLFDKEPVFTAEAMGMGSMMMMGEDFPLDMTALASGHLDAQEMEALLPEMGGGRALDSLGKMQPAYPYIDDEGTVSELATQVLALAGRQTGSIRTVVKAAMSRMADDPNLIREDMGEVEFLKVVQDSVLGWLEPGQRMLAEMQFKAIFSKYAGIKRRYAVGGGSQQGVRGEVVDDSGRPVTGQTVRVRDAAGRDFRARTDAMGQFHLFVGLRPGEYTVWTGNGERQKVLVQPSQVAEVQLQTQKAEESA
ncbi:MAG: carboxypeptidase regulatory-like domain-containing protein [Alphaproteobacteria bacterium]|nr:carboxypeptidase regulatory-like domain-containing protein [Alphaproteobacteria bacterium]